MTDGPALRGTTREVYALLAANGAKTPTELVAILHVPHRTVRWALHKLSTMKLVSWTFDHRDPRRRRYSAARRTRP